MGYTGAMAKVIGSLPRETRRNLLGTMAAAVSPLARQKQEMEEGAGLRWLLPILEQLPDSVSVFLCPSLGFFGRAECVVAGPGTVLVLATLHWKGMITTGENDEWRGAGNTDLGRPDKRALWFADRLAYGGYADGLHLEPVVVCTGGRAALSGLAPLATVVQGEEFSGFLQQVLSPGGPMPDRVLAVLGGR